MYAAYVFSVVLGGGLLLLSLLGDILGGDTGELDLEADVDVDLELEAGVDAEAEGPPAAKILSLRVVTYALFGFGAVGWIMSRMGADPAAPSTIAYAGAAGLLSGALVQRVFGWLRRTESGLLEGDTAYVGLPGAVTLPLAEGSPGSVAVVRGDRRVTLRALPHGSTDQGPPPKSWTSVVVVEMRDGVAYVVPADDDLQALP